MAQTKTKFPMQSAGLAGAIVIIAFVTGNTFALMGFTVAFSSTLVIGLAGRAVNFYSAHPQYASILFYQEVDKRLTLSPFEIAQGGGQKSGLSLDERIEAIADKAMLKAFEKFKLSERGTELFMLSQFDVVELDQFANAITMRFISDKNIPRVDADVVQGEVFQLLHWRKLVGRGLGREGAAKLVASINTLNKYKAKYKAYL